MKNNDDMLTRQGDVYTLVDKDGRLIREDINGDRKKYLLEGEGGEGGGGGVSESEVNDIVDEKITDFKNNELNDIVDNKIESLEDELNDVIDNKVNAKFEEYANKEW